MIGLLTQITITQDAIEYLVLLLLTLVAMVMGLYVVFQAYRGYRRNSSQQMLFLAIGFAFLTVIPFALSLVAAGVAQRLEISSQVYVPYLAITSRGLEICGLGAILYSLYSRR